HQLLELLVTVLQLLHGARELADLVLERLQPHHQLGRGTLRLLLAVPLLILRRLLAPGALVAAKQATEQAVLLGGLALRLLWISLVDLRPRRGGERDGKERGDEKTITPRVHRTPRVHGRFYAERWRIRAASVYHALRPNCDWNRHLMGRSLQSSRAR